MTLDRIAASWRAEYVESTNGDRSECVLCDVANAEDKSLELWSNELVFVVMNLYPYTSGHVMILPKRHVGEYEELTGPERDGIAAATAMTISAIKAAYSPEGMNVGMNIGRAAGAGIPGHIHQHVMPRWSGDTNFMTTIAEARVLPESIAASAEKLRAAWSIG